MNPNACKDKDKQVIARMKVTMMTDNQVQTMIDRIHEGGDTKMSDQLRTMITEIQKGAGGGRGDMYKGEGTGRRDEDKYEAEGMGRGGAYEGEGASGQTLLPASRSKAGGGPLTSAQ